MPAYGCCANPLHPLVLGPAPSFPWRPPGAEHVRGLAVHAVRGIHTQGALRHLVHSRRAHPRVELRHGRGHVLPDHQVDGNRVAGRIAGLEDPIDLDRKSTRLNSSHTVISYAVFCLKKKSKQKMHTTTTTPTNTTATASYS